MYTQPIEVWLQPLSITYYDSDSWRCDKSFVIVCINRVVLLLWVVIDRIVSKIVPKRKYGSENVLQCT